MRSGLGIAALLLAACVPAACSRSSSSDAPPPSPTHGPGASQQSVIVHFHYGSRDLGPLHELEGRLGGAITRAGVGELDGDEIAADGSDGTLFAYGLDADRLFAAMRPTLESAPFLRGARVTLRYGIWHEGMREAEITLGPGGSAP